jgi:hypothetical protein
MFASAISPVPLSGFLDNEAEPGTWVSTTGTGVPEPTSGTLLLAAYVAFRPAVQDGIGTQRAGNHFGLRLVDCHAVALKGKATGRTRPRQCGYAC